jgi:MerR family transcriptional regulator, thiopeptide resistance regulator
MSQAVAGVGWSVGEVARAAGVTVRTLHHYDRIGLLRPSGRTPSGYRSYDRADLGRLQRILGYRELGFSLEEIARLLDGEADPMRHLRRQRDLLAGRIERLQRMLATLERTMEAHRMGINLNPEEMLEVFGDHDPTAYADEAQARWGEGEAYRESQRRTASYTKDDWKAMGAEAEAITQRLVAAMAAGLPADSTEAMDAAQAHRDHISRWFYDCSTEIHLGLAQMYLADPRFTEHYDSVAPGLAQYVHDAIVADAARSSRG